METCVRGFSFMPTETVSAECLQYIEGEELTRKWRESRRERKKQREQKIWEEFVVNENDVLSTLCKDDPYQFLEQLPEECLKELMDVQLREMQKETVEEEVKIEELQEQPAPAVESGEEGDVFTIYDDKDDNPSGAQSPSPPSTVRALSPALSPDKASSKSSENVINVIENSIYFAKVKDLRIKISEELSNIVLSLSRRAVLQLEPETVARTCRRADEFAGRFARVHVYQLNRQIAELERHNSLALPFGQHTHFQAQMVRIASLHQNMLQAFQVFHRSIEQTACLKDSIESLRVLVTLCRQALEASRCHLAAAGHIDDDSVEEGCCSVERALSEHAACVESYMESLNDKHAPPPAAARRSKRSLASCGSRNEAGNSVSATRFSMYSLDTTRIKLKPKSSKDFSSGGTSKARADVTPRSGKRSARKKSPRKSRRPLMRAPNSGRKSKRKESKEADITTLVQTVGPITCTSSRDSMAPSPRSPRRSKDSSARPPRRPPSARSPPPRSPRRDFKRRPASPPMKRGSMQAALSSVARSVPGAAPALRPVLRADSSRGRGRSHKKPDSARTNETCHSSALRSAIETPRTKMETVRSNYTPRHAPESSRIEHDKHQTEHRTEENRAEDRAESSREAHDSRVEQAVTVKAELLTAEQRCDIARERSKCTPSRVPSPRRSRESSARLPRPPPPARSPRAPPSPRRACKRTPGSPPVKRGSVQHTENTTEDRAESRPDRSESKWEAQHSRAEQTEQTEPSPRAVIAELLTAEQRCDIARERSKTSSVSERCEVTRIVRQLCGGDSVGNRGERVSGAKNAQLVCVSSSPRQPSTPQLLRILEETIQKKVPKQLLPPSPAKSRDRHRLALNISEATSGRLFQYRTSFMQHMLASPLYANSQLGQPWQAVSRISDKIIDDIIAKCAKEIQMEDALERLYNVETR